MIGSPNRPAVTVRRRCQFILVLLLAVSVCGCSGISKTTRTLAGGGEKLKKKVALAAFVNRTTLNSSEFNHNFHDKLIARMSKACGDIILIKPGDPGYPAFLTDLPQTPHKEVDQYKLSQAARQKGFNAIVTGSFTAIRTDNIKKGYLWFKKSLPIALINISVEVFDTETAAKMIDENFTHQIEIDKNDIESIRQNHFRYSDDIQKAVTRLIDDITDKMCDEIADQSWKTYIVSTADNRIVLSAGKNTEISPGDILKVYDSTRTIDGVFGQKFFLPGLKVGEIEVSAVHDNHSEAVVVSGDGIRAGFTAKLK